MPHRTTCEIRIAGRAAACLAILSLVATVPTAAQICPNPPVVQIGPNLPADVCIPSGFGGNPIAFFDDYSWKSFLAMVWPAAYGSRGVPDTGKSITDSGARVFETYKAIWELFHSDGSAPSAWASMADPNPCGASLGFGDLVLGSFSKFGDLGQAGFGDLVGPLVAQNTTYVRFWTGFNQVEFDEIVGKQLYLRKNLPAPGSSLTLPNGSVDVKASWIDMAGIANPSRYYTRTAWLLDPATGSCAPKSVGLVGLHVVQKTPSRPQWIWSTFEQVDNVPSSGSSGPFGFNDGTAKAMPTSNPYPLDPLTLPTPAPFNVTRVKPIHTSTQKTNQAYRAALAAQNSPFQFYQLVMTQWPLAANSPATPGTPANTFPGSGSDQTSFANVTLETFDQNNIRTGCMNCHNSTMAASDFLWSLNDHAFPPAVPNLLMKSEPFRMLRGHLESATRKSSSPAPAPKP
jgi:hypothetical protein